MRIGYIDTVINIYLWEERQLKLSKIIFVVSLLASFLMLVASVIALVIHDIPYFWFMFSLMVVSILQNISVYRFISEKKDESAAAS